MLRLPAIGAVGAGAQADRLQGDACMAEGAAAGPVAGGAVGGVGAAALPMPASLASLMAGHVLREGETIILILKPSFWSIPLEMLRTVTAMLIAVIAFSVWIEHPHLYFEAVAFLLVGRLMWAVLNWMGRLYVLTDQRIIRMAGVFNFEIDDCPLRKVVRARLLITLRERLLRIGSIEIIPQDETRPIWAWQSVSQPRRVHEQVLRAIRRAKQGSGCFK
jgi:Bacterial PH domain